MRNLCCAPDAYANELEAEMKPSRDEVVRVFLAAGDAAGWKPGIGNDLVINYLTHFYELTIASAGASEPTAVYQISRKDGPASTAWIDVEEDIYEDAGFYPDFNRRVLYTHPQAGEARVPTWQPIDTAPKDGSTFLAWVSAVRYGETDEGQQYQQDVSQVDFCNWRTQHDIPDCGWFDPCCGQIGDSQAVTHWMPLPEEPIGITTKEQQA